MLDPASKILVIHTARIGDTLLLTPIMRALRQACPSGRLQCLLHPARAELFRGIDWIDEVATITPKTARLRGWLARKGWDYALVYGHDAPLIRYASRVARRIVAFDQDSEDINRLLWRKVAPPSQQAHAVHERLLLPAALGVSTSDYRLSYCVTDTEGAWAARWLADQGLASHRPLIGFQVSSFPTKAYRDWPTEHFIELGHALRARFPDARVLVLGGKESLDKARRITDALHPHATALAGKLTLRQTAAVMARLDLYVGVDTGPTHLAGALGIPMVALYHCRHRGRYLAPLGHAALRVIEHPADDDHCQRETAMRDISVETVWREAQTLLDAPAPTS